MLAPPMTLRRLFAGPAWRRIGLGIVLAVVATPAGALSVVNPCGKPPLVAHTADADASVAATATWLDARRLFWPAQPAEDAYRLVVGVPDDPDATQDVPLTIASAGASAPTPFTHFGPGVTLVLPRGIPTKQLRRWHERGMRLERLRGEVVVATARAQAGAALDALFPGAAHAVLGAHPGPQGTEFAVWAPTAMMVGV